MTLISIQVCRLFQNKISKNQAFHNYAYMIYLQSINRVLVVGYDFCLLLSPFLILQIVLNFHISKYVKCYNNKPRSNQNIIENMTYQSSSKYETFTFFEKYALKFYISILSQALTIWILISIQSGFFGLAFVVFYNMIGRFLPIKADKEREKIVNKLQNSNKYLLGPLISNCISTPVIMIYIWKNYHLLPLHSIIDALLTLTALAFIIATSIDAAHQLIHRPEPFGKIFAYLNLFCMQFTSYPTEHLYLHHKKVGTPQDPITSPKNLTIYKYYVDALFSCYKFNYNHSKQTFALTFGSTVLFNLIIIILAFKEGSGFGKVVFFTVWSYIALLLMEMVEYIEHYGLVYRSDEKAKPITEICSWNSNENELINWFIFRFQRHSDHHMNAYKVYPTLDLTDKMPQFPFDFVTGMILCLIPPLWWHIMNPLVDQVIEGKPVSKSHRNFVDNFVKTMGVALVAIFPVNFLAYLIL